MHLCLLAHSAKYGRLCVAGIDCQSGKLVRLVSSDKDSDGGIARDYIYDSVSNTPKFSKLAIISVPVKSACPDRWHKENVLIDETAGPDSWKQVSENKNDNDFRFNLLDDHVNRYKSVFLNHDACLSAEQMQNLDHSLELAVVSDLHFEVVDFGYGPKSKISFTYRDESYCSVSMTDCSYFKFNGIIYKSALVLFSVPLNEFNGRYYKFAASVIHLNSN